MSRSGYTDDIDDQGGQWELIKWRGQVASAIRGKRGQALLTEMLEALDAIPSKRLIEGELESGGEVCALGSVGLKRGLDMSGLDPDDYVQLADTFGVAYQIVQEIEYVNDKWDDETPEARWQRVRDWVVGKIRVLEESREKRT
jgi:hypothetical protein